MPTMFQVVDMMSIVEELNYLSLHELNKLLRDSESFTLHINAGKESFMQIDMERLASSLPLHLIAILISSMEDDLSLRYILCGVRLLHSLCELASRHAKLEQILLEDVKITEQILDLVFFMHVVLARYEQDGYSGSYLPLLHSALVACSLYLLRDYISLKWQDLVNVLVAHPKIDVFMNASFDALRVDIGLLQMTLSSLNTKVTEKKTSFSVAERAVNIIAQQCEASLQILQSLCQQKLFRERLLKNKDLCKNGSILSLVLAILRLNISRHFKESSTIVANVSRLKSKVLSVLRQFCEDESISYLDEVASSPRSMKLATSVALEVLELLKVAFSREPKQIDDSVVNCNPKGYLLLNCMRLADIFSDDSNFRSFIMTNITKVLAEILSLPHDKFVSNWCLADIPVIEEDATLEYDPFLAAGLAIASSKVARYTALTGPSLLDETNSVCSLALNCMPLIPHVQQRTSFLVKIIANLHCFVPDICEEQEKDQFFNKFVQCLNTGTSNSSAGVIYHVDAPKTIMICENLCSLLEHAISLVPTLLNEDDVQLLSVFFEQLYASLPSAQSITGAAKEEPVVEDAREVNEKTLKGYLYQQYQHSQCWKRYSNIDIVKHESPLMNARSSFPHVLGNCQLKYETLENDSYRLPEEAQSTGRCALHFTRKVNANSIVDVLDSGREYGDIEDGTVETSFQEVDQFKAVINKQTSPPSEVMELDRSRKKDKNGSSGCVGEVNEELGTADTNIIVGSSKKEETCLDQRLNDANGEMPKLKERVKGSGCRGFVEEFEKLESVQSDDKHRRKRKRNIMNEKQIILIERALLDEPEMQRNASLLQSWTEKLSIHGSELTSSQLKNWLNNRKARLARAARDAHAPSEGDNAFSDRNCVSNMGGHFYDSSESTGGEDFYFLSKVERGSNQPSESAERLDEDHDDGGITKEMGCETPDLPLTDFVDFAAQQMHLRYLRFEAGQCVSLTDDDGKEVCRGRICQMEGRWYGKNLVESGLCIVEVNELKVDRQTRLQHPSEAGGSTFDEAELKTGKMKVAWDVNKIFHLP
ncbi:hypothetical protein AMTRI_Chr01g137730 [Amborella trichopoda]|uniref:nodulin homeobox isoform X1 n=1 Tax=Amborella trichopoda TaxID=13333 RepID=UPI0005D2F609|nr:nodulin homeobox isoform X1 [Amborella trichopoda]XP_020527113.1 nodulin homeobox isoform X1 [Amborella trichopoda]XP_020527114.1 nodulin homeobox isoform X1 [Amborella trichopoda]XP_020527115.1 nodulin homeobox isoform X1 [Amborella trichopoda]XP_020527116.1 nodulin homeobox isoform X1 [Amborella trichopoda]|eukprot:XP_011625670.1 nodulin homeobox isoform X1 [Amborella trichopoda]